MHIISVEFVIYAKGIS